MAAQEDFEQAQKRVENLKQRPSNDELLELYAYFKQGKEGDVQGKRPGMLDVKGRAKYDAWAGKKGMGREEAMQAYVDLVSRLESKYGTRG
jgi:acyl-CoA-binding protein